MVRLYGVIDYGNISGVGSRVGWIQETESWSRRSSVDEVDVVVMHSEVAIIPDPAKRAKPRQASSARQA